MSSDCPNPPKCTLAMLALVLSLTPSLFAQDRGSLTIQTTPDSAQVVLDDTPEPEAQRTPYLNESMIPGSHRVLLRSSNPAHKSASYSFLIDKGQVTGIDHTFEYRTKAFGAEHLSIAPWKVEVSAGFEYLRYLGLQADAPKGAPTPGQALKQSSYPSDSVPSATRIPLEIRVGFPYGLESHIRIPFAQRTERDGSTPGLAFGGVSAGVKWVLSQYNSGLDLTWEFGNSNAQHLSTSANALSATLLTNQKIQAFDLFGNLGYQVELADTKDGNLDHGDRVFVELRPGFLLADKFLPYAAVHADYWLADQKNGTETRPARWVATLTPGFIWYAGQDLSLELGVPLGLLASNEETRIGVHASVSAAFGMVSATKRQGGGAAPRTSQAYSTTEEGQQANAATYVLFDGQEVTNGQYRAFCDKTGREYPPDPEFAAMPGYFTDVRWADFPVVNVSLEDARAYAKWLDKRLPTVTEWKREFGESNLSQVQVACGLDAPEAAGSRHQGSGLYHFVGNVAEWVENDRTAGAAAYTAGGFYSLPVERCLDKNRWIDIASPSGAKFIGIRLVTEIK